MHNVKSDIVYGYDPTTGYLHTAATTFKVGATFTHTITYAYNDGTGGSTNDGTRQSMSIDSGAWAFMYQSDGYSRMTSVTNPSGNTTAWSYDSNDTITTQAWNPATDNVTTTYSRTPLEGRLQSISNAPPTGSSLSLFNSGQMYYTADNQIVGWGGNRFIYNEDHRVQSDNVVGGDWAYDGMGNITSASGNELPGYTDASRFQRYYNADNQWMGYSDSLSPGLVCNWVNDIPSNPNLFNYDTAGNPTTYKGDTLEFDFANRLTNYRKLALDPISGEPVHDPYNPALVMSAEYGADGLRAWKKSYGADGMVTLAETYYLYDGDQPIMEFAGDGETCTAINTWGPNGLVSRADLRDAGTTLKDIYYLYDPLGNVVQRLDGTGVTLRVRSSDTYDAYGNRNTTGTMETVDANDPWGYKAQYGYYTDYETKLILCEHRYYDPFAGHWLTRDPIGSAGGLNLYEYCGGDPVGGVDPEGLTVFQVPGHSGWWSTETEFCRNADNYGLPCYDHVNQDGTPIGDVFVRAEFTDDGRIKEVAYKHGTGKVICCVSTNVTYKDGVSFSGCCENQASADYDGVRVGNAVPRKVVSTSPPSTTPTPTTPPSTPPAPSVNFGPQAAAFAGKLTVRIAEAASNPSTPSPLYAVNIADAANLISQGRYGVGGCVLQGGPEAFFHRPPDYCSLGGQLSCDPMGYPIGPSGAVALDSDGHVYAEPGMALGTLGVHFSVGYILKLDLDPNDKKNTFTGASYGVSGGALFEGVPMYGEGKYTPSCGNITMGVGLGTPGASAGGTYGAPMR